MPDPVYEILGASSIRRQVRIVISSDGNTLTGVLQLPSGRVLQRSYDLRPIRNVVMAKLRQYHEQMHGALPPQEVSGFFSSIFSKASDIAKKIGSSSAVKSLYNTARKYGGDAVETFAPYGDKIMKLAKKLHDRIVEARAGSEDAVAKLRKLSAMAKAGLPAAQQAMDMAKQIGATLNAKEAMDKLAPKAAGLLMAAKSGSEDAVSKLSDLKNLAEDDPKARDVMDLMSRLNEYLNAKKSGDKEAVSGWVYNNPYRGPVAAMLDKTPGIGMMARALYGQGAK